MLTKNSWLKLSDGKPKENGLYWVYIPDCIYKSGVLFGYWNGYSFDFEEDNDKIICFSEIVRPEPPKLTEKNV